MCQNSEENRLKSREYYKFLGIKTNYPESINIVKEFIKSNKGITSDNRNHLTEFEIIILTIGNALDISETDIEIKECINLIEELWGTISKSFPLIRTTAKILFPYEQYVPNNLYEFIKKEFEKQVKLEVEYSISGTPTLSFLLNHNKELLTQLLMTCKKTWFTEHTVTLPGNHDSHGKKRIKCYGIYKSDNEELFELIDTTIHPKWKPKQQKTIEDVLTAEYEKSMTPEASSHKGLVFYETGNRMEKQLSIAFKCHLEKIKTISKKHHKTPDYIIRDTISNEPIMTVECNANRNDNFIKRCEEALKHGDSKEEGWIYYSKEYKIPDDVIKVAALAIDFDPKINLMTNDKIINEVSQIKMSTKMDCFIILLMSFSNYPPRIFVFNITNRELPDVFTHDAIITPIIGHLN